MIVKTSYPGVPNAAVEETAPVEFHLTRETRDRCEFARDVYHREAGRHAVAVSEIHELAWRVNHRAKIGSGVRPGDLFALATLDHVYCALIDLYARRLQPRLFEELDRSLELSGDSADLESTFLEFCRHFPPLPAYKAEIAMPALLMSVKDGRSNRDSIWIQMLLVFVDNRNPAASLLKPLFDDSTVAARTSYLQTVQSVREFLKTQPEAAAGGKSILDLIEAPALAAPDSLLEQLEFVQREFGAVLSASLTSALLLAEDLIREDSKRGGTDFRRGKGETPIVDFGPWKGSNLDAFGSDRTLMRQYEVEPEQYTPDTDWMPRTVLIAKSIFVWLDQLSKSYGRDIRRLDEIPEEELGKLAAWGFNALWLIGIWMRSDASRRIKHLRGNIDAAASAYSLLDYTVSDELGGDAALERLRNLAAKHGIRLASDLVPNHMGIDSLWVHEHPERFLQLDRPPYPAYRFTGPNLSPWDDMEIRIEDGYWDQTDAAVVFEMRHHRTGRTSYVYHGNDGTSFPWNDTAQLNFMRQDTREAVIRQIIDVAKRFNVLRFDAAMTLTKRHYQRLWFPEPGSGGSIPSRAEHGMSREQFSRLMPVEFWREVVDRLAAEVPNCLLIAEAFWLTEGYFVRTLGMHRVYNSAFMNMLKHEENAKYRQVIRNTVDFDARVLQRYVNFMNNPDEDTAVEQFGKGDKYFGVAILMATLPGLPMFGHGQVEGFTEKYGHEYRRSYYDEQPDTFLVSRHEREVFPLLRERELFAGSEHFRLYDFQSDHGGVDENVYVYSNRLGARRALVVYHNAYARASGMLRFSDAEREGLGLRVEPGLHYLLKDRVRSLEYLVSSRQIVEFGLRMDLEAYEARVITEFRELYDDAEGQLARLAERLNSRGVPSVEREYARMHLAPLRETFGVAVSAENLKRLASLSPESGEPVDSMIDLCAVNCAEFYRLALLSVGVESRTEAVLAEFRRLANNLARLEPETADDVGDRERVLLAAFVVLAPVTAEARTNGALDTFERWLLSEILAESFEAAGCDASTAHRQAQLAGLLASHETVLDGFRGPRRFSEFQHMLDHGSVQSFLGCNYYRGILWFAEERIRELLRGFERIALVRIGVASSAFTDDQEIVFVRHQFEQVRQLAMISEYNLSRFRTLLSYGGKPARPVAQSHTA